MEGKQVLKRISMSNNVKSQSNRPECPRTAKRQARVIVFIVLVLALSVAGLSTAAADDGIMTSPKDLQDTPVTSEDSSDLDTPEVPYPTSVDAVTNVGTGSEIVRTTAGDKTIAIEVDGADQQHRIADPSGAILIRDAIGDADLRIDILETGFAVVAQLESADSPHELRFDLSLPEGATLGLNDDGSIDIIDTDGFSIGTFAAPWASDTNGTLVPTTYSIDDSAIVQTVNRVSEDLYPVLADPEFNWGILSGTIYFSRSETSDICFGGIATLTALANPGPHWAYPIVASVAALATFFVMAQVCIIYLFGGCLKLKSYPGYIFSYTGGYCR